MVEIVVIFVALVGLAPSVLVFAVHPLVFLTSRPVHLELPIVAVIRVCVLKEYSLSKSLVEQLLEPLEVFVAEVSPELNVLLAYDVLILDVTRPQDVNQLLLVTHEELLDGLDFVLELDGHLIDLRTLHVVVVNLVPPDGSVVALLLVLYDQLVLHVVSPRKFINYESLHCHDVHNVELGLDVVQDENGHLVCH